jgi:hypothetical protein
MPPLVNDYERDRGKQCQKPEAVWGFMLVVWAITYGIAIERQARVERTRNKRVGSETDAGYRLSPAPGLEGATHTTRSQPVALRWLSEW